MDKSGPAFPSPNYICDSARIDKDAFQKMGLTQGMTLRDFFAGQALTGELANGPGTWRSSTQDAEKCANRCYLFAAAMLAARKDSNEAKAE